MGDSRDCNDSAGVVVAITEGSLRKGSEIALAQLCEERDALREMWLKERERFSEKKEKEKEKEKENEETLDLYSAWHAVYGFFPMSVAGHSHWHHDPSLAFMYATTFGFLAMGTLCDPLFVTLCLCCSPPHKATLRWKIVRTQLVLYYAFLMSTFAAYVFPMFFRVDAFFFRCCGGIFALYVGGDYGLLTSSWLRRSDETSLLTVEPGPMASALAGLRREATDAADPALLPPWAFLVAAYTRRMVRPETGDPRLRRLWEVVGSDLGRLWNVETLAALVGVSGEHLRRLCHQHFGRSPMSHVAALRMRQAMALLASESYTIEAVAQQVGYDSPFAFSAAFKRHQGISPSEYRRKAHGR